MNDKDIELGTRIKKIRQSRGMTQLDLAKKIGTSQTAIALWESGNRSMSFEVIDRISIALSVSASYLLFGEKDFKDDIPDESSSMSNLTVAAHFDGDEFTEEELEDIRKYAEFVKSRRKKEQ
nr:helix-turn-helix transcriptional regulator [uncultured Enterocloster sp.]